MFNAVSDLFLNLLTNIALFFNGSFGISIILITILIRIILYPIVVPSIKSQKKMLSLKPELDALKKKYGHNKTTLNQKQLELYQHHKINPAAGCLPQLVQIGLFIIFYQVLSTSLQGNLPPEISLNFLWLNLATPDNLFILPIVAGVTQFLLGLMLTPGADASAQRVLASSTRTKKDDKQAEDASDMAQAMQTQMLYIMPFITVFFAFRFPSGLALYWVISTIFSIVQQYLVSGPGGLATFPQKVSQFINSKRS